MTAHVYFTISKDAKDMLVAVQRAWSCASLEATVARIIAHDQDHGRDNDEVAARLDTLQKHRGKSATPLAIAGMDMDNVEWARRHRGYVLTWGYHRPYETLQHMIVRAYVAAGLSVSSG